MDPHVCHDVVNISFENKQKKSTLNSKLSACDFPVISRSTVQSPISVDVDQMIISSLSAPSFTTAASNTPFERSGNETYNISDDVKEKFESENFINGNFF